MAVTFETQLKLNSIINHLVREEGETYDVVLGRELRDIVNGAALNPMPALRIGALGASDSTQMSGYAAGVGNITHSDSKKKHVSLGNGESIASGSWLLKRIGKSGAYNAPIIIENRFNQTRVPKDYEMYMLYLDEKSEPGIFCKLEFKDISFRIFKRTFGFSRAFTKPMKIPAHYPSV